VEQEFSVLVKAQLTDADRPDGVSFVSGKLSQYYQNAMAHGTGQRLTVPNVEKHTLNRPSRFSDPQQETLAAAATIRNRMPTCCFAFETANLLMRTKKR
jgi:hypothetical protein